MGIKDLDSCEKKIVSGGDCICYCRKKNGAEVAADIYNGVLRGLQAAAPLMMKGGSVSMACSSGTGAIGKAKSLLECSSVCSANSMKLSQCLEDGVIGPAPEPGGWCTIM